MSYIKKIKGFGLVEVVIGSAIILTAMLAATTSYRVYIRYSFANQRNSQAGYLLEEGVEAITFLRDKGWTQNIATLATTSTYYIYFNGSYWEATTTEQYIGGVFLRSFSVGDIKRDANDDIVSSGGTYDPATKLITASISYPQLQSTTTKTFATYISNIYNN